MKKTFIISFILITVVLLGCAGQLAIKEISANPMEIYAGDNATLIVKFGGPKDQISSVIATVREAPQIIYTLNDSGEDGDEQASDNIWTCFATVPFEAEPDQYNLDICARDKEGNEIISEGLENQSTGRSGTISVIVK